VERSCRVYVLEPKREAVDVAALAVDHDRPGLEVDVAHLEVAELVFT
jgi:hypothetical protein